MDEVAAPPLAVRARRTLEIWLPLAILALDQITKEIVRRGLDLHESATVVPGLLDFTHVRNAGAAFGILNSADFPYKTVSRLRFAGWWRGRYSASLSSHQPGADSAALTAALPESHRSHRHGYVVDFVDVIGGVSLGFQRSRLGD
jgi:signal peptidase II